MAYMCVLACNHECDGCQECEGYNTERPDEDSWDDFLRDSERDNALYDKYMGEAMI